MASRSSAPRLYAPAAKLGNAWDAHLGARAVVNQQAATLIAAWLLFGLQSWACLQLSTASSSSPRSARLGQLGKYIIAASVFARGSAGTTSLADLVMPPRSSSHRLVLLPQT
ncbi:hypothetical protein Cob_v008562 [Colletotrichum orbiculare MAFF 240422]|uniref:Uncharacterized protein n=1 Tax=Colletotrichum orbiculare (strain 104-T / ATCC 96160 / CBS 514.97 / LARS 414 / MAFF 240422) TaxID=1213857 RepID=A0A484FKJ3_COLOR|nr:hypothetical protein Cob_v008562 [Colletotrichum orbiculare MAFF 240422]